MPLGVYNSTAALTAAVPAAKKMQPMMESPPRNCSKTKTVTKETANMASVPSQVLREMAAPLKWCLPKRLPISAAAASPRPQA